MLIGQTESKRKQRYTVMSGCNWLRRETLGRAENVEGKWHLNRNREDVRSKACRHLGKAYVACYNLKRDIDRGTSNPYRRKEEGKAVEARTYS